MSYDMIDMSNDRTVEIVIRNTPKSLDIFDMFAIFLQINTDYYMISLNTSSACTLRVL